MGTLERAKVVKIDENTYQLVWERPRNVKEKRVAKRLQDPNEHYCECGKRLRSSNRSGRCSECVAKTIRQKKVEHFCQKCQDVFYNGHFGDSPLCPACVHEKIVESKRRKELERQQAELRLRGNCYRAFLLAFLLTIASFFLTPFCRLLSTPAIIASSSSFRGRTNLWHWEQCHHHAIPLSKSPRLMAGSMEEEQTRWG